MVIINKVHIVTSTFLMLGIILNLIPLPSLLNSIKPPILLLYFGHYIRYTFDYTYWLSCFMLHSNNISDTALLSSNETSIQLE